MTRIFLHILAGIFLSVIEASFFGSLQGVFRFTPFVLVISVYLLQHHSMKSAASWMIIHGLLLDFTGASVVPLVTVAYLITAWVALLSAERIFSNRSFYGVAACAGLSYVTFQMATGFLQLAFEFTKKQPFHWGTYFSDAGARLLMLFLSLLVLYSFAKQIRSGLVKLSLLPPSRQTY
ncbi:hypothetical protein A3C09_00200 [Candidatus Uhrbacteria bacterium RIFCSPHIGHO2_02_FULL_47_44]|uniref:Rod shape-determining protein MreD n=1 Tax=Candidatus Uhrbacteria bacterium RIFCSPLOWO2_02_FULL_48_18 TaxID=1802408 RepID=A0A1F7VC49_9BACT|nr:MAG: hypothetical protein A2839_03085 [Candidatus Uhrbacteria bacterium RIFCSPHIGHO2_01_FULL_47_10]OGL70118.1 MAG: hypothetical protein A3C09_00200 [Candidatus Uhrbacteria bacterium RIFCSPHIGHO2_02_FULL_47_44]OGL76773.1 MAG: hypothetical protein A3E97_03745 [Candidatus Uhrbacteria bacterium RIFCSPHIGHO2_12_FULL_47_12]OGL82357.1 MAG: hypothetical protein A3B20_01220 [Candidatus Uhrbacteria bacterium RIFCSPLOWO2_01_FULL_47_17]OGL88003.1 MAG: hypothetical protein A3I41_02750 [Candidatus Uhrbact